MADSEALRSRRKRRHAAGDHSICRGCDGRAPLQAVPAEAGDAVPCTDPAGELAALAGRLRDAHKADPGNALIARELRSTLLALPPADDDDDDPLAELRALVADVP